MQDTAGSLIAAAAAAATLTTVAVRLKTCERYVAAKRNVSHLHLRVHTFIYMAAIENSGLRQQRGPGALHFLSRLLPSLSGVWQHM